MKKIFFYSLALLFLMIIFIFWRGKEAFAASCLFPNSGDTKIGIPCTFAPGTNVDGVDYDPGTGTNSAKLTIGPGASLTLTTGQMLGFGIIKLDKVATGGGSIVLGDGAELRRYPIWYPDQDNDGFPSNVYIAPTGIPSGAGKTRKSGSLPQAAGGSDIGAWSQTNQPTRTPSKPMCGIRYYKGYFYELGGLDDVDNLYYPSVASAPLTSGNVGTWVAQSPIPTSAAGNPGYSKNNGGAFLNYGGTDYVYIIGGESTVNTGVTNVWKGTIGASGVITSWAATTALPATYRNNTVESDGTYIYNIGGIRAGSSTAIVLKGTITTNGDVSGWTALSPMPAVRSMHASELANINGTNYIYTFGGGASTNSTTVYRGTLDANGVITGWATLSPMPASLRSNDATIITTNGNNYVFVFGGYNGSAQTSTVYKGAINSSGVITNWAPAITQTPLPHTSYYHQTVCNTADTAACWFFSGENATDYGTRVYKAPLSGTDAINIDCNDGDATKYPGHGC